MAYTKQNVSTGDDGTADWANHVQTQYDEVVTEIGLGNIVGPASMISSGQFPLARMPRAASGVLKANGTGSDPSYQSLVTGDIPQRYATLYLSAAGGKPRASNGCAPLTWTELSTNKIMVPTLDFDPSTVEYAQWAFAMPDGYTGGNVYVKVYWTAASGSGVVIWVVNMRFFGDDDALDSAFSNYVSPNDTLLAANDMHITSSVTLTPDGTPAGGKWAVVQVRRAASDGGDTLTSDAKLIGIKVEYPTAYTD